MVLIVEYRDAYGAGMRRAPRASGGGSTSERLVPIGRLVAAVSVRNDQRTVAGGGGVPMAAAAMEVNENPRSGRLRLLPRQVAFIRAVMLGPRAVARAGAAGVRGCAPAHCATTAERSGLWT